MKPSIKILLTAAFISAFSLGGLARAVSANESHPAVMVQYHSNQMAEASERNGEANDGKETSGETNERDREIKDDKVPVSLNDIGKYGENLYDMAKVNDWTKATANLTSLQDAARRLRTDLKGGSTQVAQLNTTIATLNKAVAAKDHQAAMLNSNQVTLIAAKMTAQFEPKVPVEVTLLDYYGRELEIWAATGNTAKLKTTAVEMRRTWSALRPSVQAHRGSAQAQQFDNLLARVEAAKSPAEYGSLATPVLNAVDNLEKVFTV